MSQQLKSLSQYIVGFFSKCQLFIQMLDGYDVHVGTSTFVRVRIRYNVYKLFFFVAMSDSSVKSLGNISIFSPFSWFVNLVEMLPLLSFTAPLACKSQA